jgi:phosphoserine aminotransferase
MILLYGAFMKKPKIKPKNINFASGPSSKRAGWTPNALKGALVGRYHKSDDCIYKVREVLQKSRDILGIPKNYKLAIVPASDTGAVELALWNLLGKLPVEVLVFGSFSKHWAIDIAKELKIKNCKILEAGFGKLPNLQAVKSDTKDIVFTLNATTAGTCVPANMNWLKSKRKGLTICDGSSGVFAYNINWKKLDVITWSWQKVMGGEAGFGMLALSPKAVKRLESFSPKNRPIPKVFRIKKNGKLDEEIFDGYSINTLSMLAVEDAIDSLNWIKKVGGLKGSVKRVEQNYKVLETFVNGSEIFEFLCPQKQYRSKTSVCLKIVDKDFAKLSKLAQKKFLGAMIKLLEKEKVAYDISSYRYAPLGLRIWCGPTINLTDLKALTSWLEWAFIQLK